MIRVLVVDDHAWVRESLTLLIATTDDVVVVGECADGSTVPAAVATAQPDVVLMDVQMPTVSGLEATRLLKASGATARVIIIGTLHVVRAGGRRIRGERLEEIVLLDSLRKLIKHQFLEPLGRHHGLITIDDWHWCPPAGTSRSLEVLGWDACGRTVLTVRSLQGGSALERLKRN